MKSPAALLSHFSELEDPRNSRAEHPLESLVFISIVAIVCGAETWNEIEDFGQAKQEWLSTLVPLPHGVPSHDTFNRFFAALVPGSFETCFGRWAGTVCQRGKGEVVNLDGKTMRGSRGLNASPAHIVTAWSGANAISLGQLRVDAKSNEGKAIPKLLETLFLEGCIVTIDAAGCLPAIALAIRDKGADYVLCAKGNQPKLLDAIEQTFALKPVTGTWEELDADHGRITTRTCSVIEDLSLIPKVDKWPDLRTLVRVDSHTYHKATGKASNMCRYYITSLAPDAELAGRTVRSHWSIENSLHWQLDVSYREDASRKRKDNAAVNFSALVKMTLTMLKRDLSTKVGIRSKRLKAGWDNEYLLRILSL
jgi:predicted transposase YbfD/YdcC